jgi:hypothetical protein
VFERIRDESAYHQTNALIDPTADKYRHACNRQDIVSPAPSRNDQQDKGNYPKECGRPHPGNEPGMTMQTGKQVHDRMHMSWYLTVKGCKAFKQEEEYI